MENLFFIILQKSMHIFIFIMCFNHEKITFNLITFKFKKKNLENDKSSIQFREMTKYNIMFIQIYYFYVYYSYNTYFCMFMFKFLSYVYHYNIW